MNKRSVQRMLMLLMMICALVFLGKETVNAQSATTHALAVVGNKTGFHPSPGNYVAIHTSVAVSGAKANMRLRVVNANGKYVYQKTFSGMKANSYCFVRWSGKAVKGNAAGVAAGKYVPQGKYKVIALTYYKAANGKKHYSKKVVSLNVNYTAPAGRTGQIDVNYVPILTGNRDIDYLAEIMCKAAGIKASMSQNEKVKRIYHWMTYNFHHVHYSLNGTYTQYYNVNSLQAQISSYRKSVNKQIKAGNMVFNFYYPYHIVWNMERRIGQCTQHAQIFKILCNHVGVEADVHHGYYLNRNGTRMPHYWNSAIINGKRYYYDVDVELQNLGRGQGDYYWYKKSKTEAVKTHLFQ